MTFASGTQFYVYLPWVNACFNVLNVKEVVAAFNQEKAQVGALSVIVQLCRLIVNSSSYYYWFWYRAEPRQDALVTGGHMVEGVGCHLASAVVAGVTATMVASPVDVVKTRSGSRLELQTTFAPASQFHCWLTPV